MLKEMNLVFNLPEVKKKSQILVELAPAIIYTTDGEGIITSLNPAVESITGRRADELIGQPLLSLICPDDVARTEKELTEQRKKSNLVSLESSIITKASGDLISEIKEKTHTLPDGRKERIGIIRDVTERYMLEKQKDLWMGIATHELKTPLASIKAFAQILEAKAKHSKFTGFTGHLEQINRLTDEMAGLVNDLLDVTRIRTGKLDLELEQFDLTELIYETLKKTQPTHKSHKVVIAAKETYKITGDRYRISQVVQNLVNNAIKYSEPGTQVTLDVQSKKNKVLLSVQDRGRGISSKNLKKIFDLFYRANEGPHSTGMGLGLFICNAIVTAHNGKIWVESKVGEGSKFFVEFPKSS